MARKVFCLVLSVLATSTLEASNLGVDRASLEEAGRLRLEASLEGSGIEILSSQSLALDESSDVSLDAMQLHTLSDGSFAVQGEFIAGRNLEARSLIYTLDMRAMTYTLLELDPNSMAPADVTDFAKGLPDADVSPSHRHDRDKPHTRDCGEPCNDTCAGGWTVNLRTLDPILIWVADTQIQGTWRRLYDHVNGGCKWTGGGTAGCLARNPTPQPFNTHWYKTSCGLGGPTLSDGYFTGSARGKYYNWDFLQNNLRTDVNAWVELTLRPNIGVGWSFTHTATGEASSFLSGAITVSNGTNTCF